MPEYEPTETAIIVLGDFGANFYLSKHDWKIKHHAAKFGYTIYALLGNHKQRASLVKNMEKTYDNFVHGYVYMEQEFSNIKYFADEVAEYEIMGKKVLCIPGAYSVDKWYRLQNGWRWFAQEQWYIYEDKSGAEYFVHLKFIDKCTGRYWIQANTVNHWLGSFGWRIWDKMNWFIVEHLDVWSEPLAKTRNYDAWREYNKNVRKVK